MTGIYAPPMRIRSWIDYLGEKVIAKELLREVKGAADLGAAMGRTSQPGKPHAVRHVRARDGPGQSPSEPPEACHRGHRVGPGSTTATAVETTEFRIWKRCGRSSATRCSVGSRPVPPERSASRAARWRISGSARCGGATPGPCRPSLRPRRHLKRTATHPARCSVSGRPVPDAADIGVPTDDKRQSEPLALPRGGLVKHLTKSGECPFGVEPAELQAARQSVVRKWGQC